MSYDSTTKSGTLRERGPIPQWLRFSFYFSHSRFVNMIHTTNLNSSSPTTTLPVAQSPPNTGVTGQPIYPQPEIASGAGAPQVSPVMYQMAYQPGAQPMMPPAAYTYQAFAPVNPMPSE